MFALAGELGFEPRLTESEVRCSTVELFPIRALRSRVSIKIHKAYQWLGRALRLARPMCGGAARSWERSRAALQLDRAATDYLISHDVPCEQLTFHETKPPRSPLGPT